MCEVVIIKLRVQWRLQDFGKARNVCCLRTAARKEQNQPKGKAMVTKTTSSNAEGMGLLKHFGVYILPQITPDADDRTVGFNVCPARFQFCFGPIPFYSPVLFFWNGNIILCSCILEAFIILFIFIGT